MDFFFGFNLLFTENTKNFDLGFEASELLVLGAPVLPIVQQNEMEVVSLFFIHLFSFLFFSFFFLFFSFLFFSFLFFSFLLFYLILLSPSKR